MIAPLFGLLAGALIPGLYTLRAWGNLTLAIVVGLAGQFFVGVMLGQVTRLIAHYPQL